MNRLAAALLVLLASTSAFAQLDEHCTISILNRTAQVSSDGSWEVRGVPSNLGPVRARATCVRNGVTTIGSSELFTVPFGNATIEGVGMDMGAPVPVPTSLALSAAQTSLPGAGATTQLTAMASYASGSPQDVTAAGTGITYRSTNPNVASVDAGGLVTARASGNVIISATYEGTLALIRIMIAAVLDSDGDGIPDDWETQNGLNPFDSADAAKDLDNDGLTNLREYNLGTNPQARDTDGDGVSDGLEVTTGTDPLNPLSYNLAAVLSSISVAPNPLSIVLDTVVGANSRYVRVTGQMVDGNTLDLTAKSKGTNYQIANTAIATVGAADGQITGVNTGSTTLTVSNSGFSASVPVTVTRFTTSLRSVLTLPFGGTRIAVFGNTAYVAAGTNGLIVVDVTDRANPRVLTTLFTGSTVNAVAINPRTHSAYLAASGSLTVIDVSVPTSPVNRFSVLLGGTASDVAVSPVSDTAFVAAGTAGLKIVDEATRAVIGTATVPGTATRVAVGQNPNLAVVANNSTVLEVVDVTNLAQPVVKASVSTSTTAVRMWGQYAYVSNGSSTLWLVGLTDPAAATILEGSVSIGFANDIAVYGGMAFYTLNGTGIGFVDIGNYQAPALNSTFTTAGATQRTVAADGHYVYSVGGTNNTSLYIIQYVGTADTGSVAPSVSITSPQSGTSFFEGALVNLSVSSFDDVGVDSIDVYQDPLLWTSFKTSLQSIQYRIPLGVNSVTLHAVANDFGGFQGSSPSITLPVLRDTTPPAVQLTSPADGITVSVGQSVTVSATASDNAAIRTVDLLVNGNAVATLSKAPFTTIYTIPSGSSTLTFSARATDWIGLTTTSSSVTVNVQPDQPPAVSITKQNPVTGVFQGTELHLLINATDDIRVSKVEVLLNGSVAKTKTTAPYEFFVPLPLAALSATFSVRVTDSIGQTASTPTQTVTMTPTSAVGAVTVPGFANGLALSGNVVYVAAGASGLQVVDVTTPAAPAVIGGLALPGNAGSVAVAGHYAFVAAGTAGLQVVDVATPASPVAVTSRTTPGEAYTVMVEGQRLWVSGSLGVDVFDIRNPLQPRFLFRIDTAGPASSVAVSGNTAYVVSDRSGADSLAGNCASGLKCGRLGIYDLSDPGAASLRGSLTIPNGQKTHSSIAVSGTTVFTGGTDDLAPVDAADRSNPVLLATFEALDFTHFGWEGLRIRGNTLFVARADFSTRTTAIYDVIDPSFPSEIGQIDFSPFGGTFNGQGIEVGPELTYTVATQGSDTFFPRGTTGVSKLFIGRYTTVQDAAAVAPTISIAAPADGASVNAHELVPIRANATDDVAVASVQFLVDGQPVSTQPVPPYTYYYEVPAGGTQHVITATATDFGGNSTTAVPITINVSGDTTAPAVRITTPVAGESLPGSNVRIRVDATDNFSVASVSITVNGSVVATVNAPPYETDYAIPGGVTHIVVGATATDVASNTGTASEVAADVVLPTILGSVNLPGFPIDMAVSGKYAYVGAGTGGLVVVDLTNPAAPTVVNTVAGPRVHAVGTSGNYLFATDDTTPRQLIAYDISNPPSPQLAGTAPFYGSTIDVSNVFVYYSSALIDVRNLSSMVRSDFLINGNGFWLSAATDGKLVANIEKTTAFVAPDILDSYIINSNLKYQKTDSYQPGGSQMNAVKVAGGHVDVATSAGGIFGTIYGTRMGSFGSVTDGGAGCVARNGRFSMLGGNGFQVRLYDTDSPGVPRLAGGVDTSGLGALQTIAISATPNIIVGLLSQQAETAGAKLYVARYRTFTDTFGIAPAITLNFPDTPAVAGQLIALRAVASDDVGVASVTFTVNGSDVFTDLAAPYELLYRIPPGTTSITFGARAIDFGGSSTTVNNVTLTVSP